MRYCSSRPARSIAETSSGRAVPHCGQASLLPTTTCGSPLSLSLGHVGQIHRGLTDDVAVAEAGGGRTSPLCALDAAAALAMRARCSSSSSCSPTSRPHLHLQSSLRYAQKRLCVFRVTPSSKKRVSKFSASTLSRNVELREQVRCAMFPFFCACESGYVATHKNEINGRNHRKRPYELDINCNTRIRPSHIITHTLTLVA